MNRETTISRILELQQNVIHFEQSKKKKKALRDRFQSLIKQFVIYTVIGRKLSRSLVNLIKAVHDRKRPYLGTELALTLEAINRKIMGYKRWLIIMGLLLALPGIISVYLLWEQNQAIKVSKNNKIDDLRNNNRVELLITIYHTIEKSESGLLTTPFFSASNRRNAVFELIEWDSQRLELLEGDEDIFRLNRMVDISVAPLNEVDFSPIPGEQAYTFKNIGFVNSNFENASFEGCSFENVWFSNAQLYSTNFRNTRFVNTLFDEALIIGADFRDAEFVLCNFEGAQFDSTTLWPEGFDPVANGATPMEETGS